MIRTKTDFTIKVNPKVTGDLSAQSNKFKTAYLSRGGKYLSFNTLTGKFTVDATQEPIVVKTVIATNIQAVIGARTTYSDSKNTTTTDVNWNQVIDKPIAPKPTNTLPLIPLKPVSPNAPIIPTNRDIPINKAGVSGDFGMWAVAIGIGVFLFGGKSKK